MARDDSKPKAERPASVEAEMSYLGAFVFEPTVRSEMLTLVDADDFAIPKHKLLFETVKRMHLAGRPIDLVILLDELRKSGQDREAGGPDYLMALVDGVPNGNSGPDYARNVAEFAKRRRVIRACHDIAKAVETNLEGVEAMDVSAILTRLTTALTQEKSAGTMRPVSEYINEAINLPGKPEDTATIRIPKIDQNFSFTTPGEVTILAGRPGSGKSSFARQVSLEVSAHGPVAFFPLEVTPQTLTAQFVCELARIDFNRFSKRQCTDDELISLVTYSENLAAKPIHICEVANLTTIDVRLHVQKITAAVGKPKLVIIDYLGLMKHEEAERNDLRIGATTRALKLMALEFGIPFLVLCQMNREFEKRGGETEYARPRVSDLRDSGNIEQDADNIAFLWPRERGGQHLVEEVRVFTLEKCRNGSTFELDLMFQKAKGRFYETRPDGSPATIPGEPDEFQKYGV